MRNAVSHRFEICVGGSACQPKHSEDFFSQAATHVGDWTKSQSGMGPRSFRWSFEAWPSEIRAMRLTVCRKVHRCSQSIAVCAPSQSFLSVWWTGRVACGYIGHSNTTTQVWRARMPGKVLGQSPANICGARG